VRRGAVGLRLPARYRRFLAGGEHARFGHLHLDAGYLVGSFRLDFVGEALRDPRHLGAVQGIEDLMDGVLDWPSEFPQHIPLSTLIDPALDEPSADESVVVRSFLVIDASKPACPVAIWDYDGWKLYPLADSLDDFLDGRATAAHVEFPPRFRLG
jgi:hypothetical protein